jgi:hypothetical protein
MLSRPDTFVFILKDEIYWKSKVSVNYNYSTIFGKELSVEILTSQTIYLSTSLEKESFYPVETKTNVWNINILARLDHV